MEEYCIENKIAYIPYASFADIQREVEKIQIEDEQKTGGVGKPARFNPRANLWRRVSSQQAIKRFVIHSPTREEKMFLWPTAFSEYSAKNVDAVAA